MGKTTDAIHERFLSKIIVTEDCWNWIGYIKKSGYGEFSSNNKKYLAHRVSFSIFNGSLVGGLVIDHKCKNRKCVNPDHLRQVTQRINVIENSLSIQAENHNKTHCKNGHELIGENLLPHATGRDCKICRYSRSNLRRRNKRNG